MKTNVPTAKQAAEGLKKLGEALRKIGWRSFKPIPDKPTPAPEIMSDIKIKCLSCGWRGKESELIDVQYFPDDNYIIWGEMVTACPKCRSVAWEPENHET